jgi:hypothetical protein
MWAAVEGMYASQNKTKVVNTRLLLSMAHKGTQSITEYVGVGV